MISSNYGAAGSSSAALSQIRQQIFAKLDTDSSGGVDETEFLTGAGVSDSSTDSTKASLASKLFESFDSDSDGQLTQDELSTGFQQLSDQMRSLLISQQESSRPQPPAGPPSAEELLTKLDSNSDGGVDESEFIAGAPQDGRGPDESQLKEMFASFDTDGDGSLTAEELDTGFKNSRPSGPPPSGGPGGPGGAGGPPPSGGPGGSGGAASATSSSDDDDEDDTLLEMLQASLAEATSTSVNKQDLASILSSFLKLQQSGVSQTYSATA